MRTDESTHLRSTDFSLQPSGATWTSPVTKATYPVRWKIAVPKLGLELDVKTPLAVARTDRRRSSRDPYARLIGRVQLRIEGNRAGAKFAARATWR